MFGYQSAKGFTLIEVLVSTIILAIGLLGLAAMQTMALKDNQDAFFYSQASSLAYEMSDRIKVNAAPWQSATLPTANSCGAKLCNFADQCTADEMATFDYCAWISNVQSRIGSGATARVDISPYLTSCTGGATRRCLTISWSRNKKLGTGADTVANTTNTFQLEVTP